MNVLLTGASGFLGSRIYGKLTQNHAVTTLGRTHVGNQHVSCDLAKQVPNLSQESFDSVINSFGKAHSTPRNAAERADYERVNVEGTARLLTALEQLPILPKAFVHISSVLVYGRSEGQLLDENVPLDASDVYGYSKVRAEAVVRRWCDQTGVRLTILRLPLVAAEQPTGNLATLMNAIRRGYYVRIGDGAARRSMVRVDDVAAVIMRAAQVGGTFNLTDGCHPTVRHLEDTFSSRVGQGRQMKRPILRVPIGVAKAVARVGDGINAAVGRKFPLDSITLKKLTGSLTFSDEAARRHLNWNPRPVLDLFK